ncbi:MAG: nucleotide exchange factor GrpE [Candidatus Zixiibacteriota bacterium]|nr:MAG: nucleotide exchange factor GrpE [candidate division Zixibacteria bacterium]
MIELNDDSVGPSTPVAPDLSEPLLPDPNPAPAAPQNAAPGPAAAVHPPPDPWTALPALFQEPLGSLSAALDGLAVQVSRLQDDFESKIQYDAAREAQFNQLHQELMEYKSDLLGKITGPLIRDLIALHDDLDSLIAHPAEFADEASRDTHLKILRHLQQYLLDILEKQDVYAFRLEGPEFDPRQQQNLRSVPTPEESLNRRLSGRRRVGFRQRERLLRPEGVEVYLHVPPPAPARPREDQPETSHPEGE